MANKSIPELTENVSPRETDLAYLAIKSRLGLYYDRKCSLKNFKKQVVLDKTMKKTSDYTVLTGDCDKRWFSNQGASVNIVLTLPTAAEGYEVGFVVEENRKITVTPQSGDKVAPIGGAGVSVESSTQGSSIYLKGYAGGWLAVSEGGTWSV